MGAAVEVGGAGGKALVNPAQALGDVTRQVQEGRCAEAMPTLETLIAAQPAVAKAHYLAGFCNAQLGHPDRAVASLERTLELQPKFPGAALLEGQVLAGLGRNDDAEALLKREISNAGDPELVVDAWVALGILYRERGRNPEAIDAFRQVVALAPKRPEPYAELASLHMKADQLDKAAQILQQGHDAGAGSANAALLLNVGVAYYRKKAYREAQETFRSVIAGGASDRELGTAYALLGRCQLRDGKTAEARASLEKSLQLDASSDLAEETRQLLRSQGPGR
jgi:Tfp pilus assembly protein PilF